MIYLDNNATTALAPEVAEEMLKEFSLTPLNPSSYHRQGQLAKSLLLGARSQIGDFFGLPHSQILFTSSATEGLSWLIHHFTQKPIHIISSNIEHSAVYQPLLALSNTHKVTFLPVGEKGHIEINDLAKAISPETGLIILGAVNSETGVINPILEIASIAEKHNIPLVVDGVALLGKEKLFIHAGVTAIVFSAHKMHGPKGIGCIALAKHLKLSPLYLGGGQEYGLRSGTENLGGILGFARAIQLVDGNEEVFSLRMKELRDHFESELKAAIPNIEINGTGPRAVNVSNLYFPQVDAETLLIALDQAGICASHGSACSSGSLEPSRILLNMGYPRKRAKHSVRFSLSRMTTREELEKALEILQSLLRKFS